MSEARVVLSEVAVAGAVRHKGVQSDPGYLQLGSPGLLFGLLAARAGFDERVVREAGLVLAYDSGVGYIARVASYSPPVLPSPAAGYDLHRGEAARGPDLGCGGGLPARYRSPGRRRLHGVDNLGYALPSCRALSSQPAAFEARPPRFDGVLGYGPNRGLSGH